MAILSASQHVCLSVCLSVTLVNCVKIVERIELLLGSEVITGILGIVVLILKSFHEFENINECKINKMLLQATLHY